LDWKRVEVMRYLECVDCKRVDVVRYLECIDCKRVEIVRDLECVDRKRIEAMSDLQWRLTLREILLATRHSEPTKHQRVAFEKQTQRKH